jgi:hypothetical protein
MAQVVERLPSKCKAPILPKKKKEKGHYSHKKKLLLFVYLFLSHYFLTFSCF